MKSTTIFVQVAAYRDPDLKNTILSGLQNATHPDQLRWGLYHQYDESTQDLLKEFRDDSRFTIVEVPWQTCQGVGHARAECNALYRNERYFLQIDAHMRFAKGWDAIAVAELNKCPGTNELNKALTEYPMPFITTKDGIIEKTEHYVAILVPKKLEYGFVPTFEAKPTKEQQQQVRFAAGGFLFGPGRIAQIAYAREVCFTGEEILLSLRLWEHGIQLFAPTQAIVWHLYDRPLAHRFWRDLPTEYEKMQQNSLLKLKAELLLSSSRTKGFEGFCGIDFTHGLLLSSQKNNKHMAFYRLQFTMEAGSCFTKADDRDLDFVFVGFMTDLGVERARFDFKCSDWIHLQMIQVDFEAPVIVVDGDGDGVVGKTDITTVLIWPHSSFTGWFPESEKKSFRTGFVLTRL